MIGQASLTEPVSGNMDISIICTGPEYNLSDPIWAINWFDLKSNKLYDLYLVLASSHVNSVKARLFFKGRLIKRVLGEDEMERELLVIVNYPGPDRFMHMVKSKLFQFKSILRVLAVKDFTFGFMKRRDDGRFPVGEMVQHEETLIYLVHHFQGNREELDALQIKSIAAEYDIFTHFIGSKSHLIGRRRKNDKLKTAPFYMDGLILLGAFEEEQFNQLLASAYYNEFVKSNASNYIALFRRDN